MKTFLLIAGVVLGLGRMAYTEEFAVIVNATNAIEAGSIRDVFLGEKKFQGDIKLIPMHSSDEKVKGAFLATFVKMSAKDYKAYMVKKVFQDGIMAPVAKSSPKEIVDFVAEEEGAVGYVPKAYATGPRIKIVATFADQP